MSFGPVGFVGVGVELFPQSVRGVKPPRRKALTGQRTPKPASSRAVAVWSQDPSFAFPGVLGNALRNTVTL
jgi:hypothetical protein